MDFCKTELPGIEWRGVDWNAYYSVETGPLVDLMMQAVTRINMVDLFKEDDLEGAMKPQLQLCNTKCSRSQRCKRHVMHHPSWQGQAHVLFHPKDSVRCQAYIAWNKDDAGGRLIEAMKNCFEHLKKNPMPRFIKSSDIKRISDIDTGNEPLIGPWITRIWLGKNLKSVISGWCGTGDSVRCSLGQTAQLMKQGGLHTIGT